ncbi:MAG: phosphotransferase [Anaerolineae bacterium]|nr:phosphotransferase [Anaerolineae bacterium]
MRRRVPLVAELHQAAEHPLIKRLYSPSAWSFMLRLWDAHPRWLDLLDSFPQTFCHLDTFRRNLIARTTKNGADETVVLDWAFAGLAPFGADLAPLIWVSAIFREINPHMILGSEQAIFASYMQGLTEAGWRGSVQQVRFAYLAMALMNVAIPTELMQFLNESAHPALERGFGFPVPEIISNWAVLLNVAASYWNEIRALESTLTSEKSRSR